MCHGCATALLRLHVNCALCGASFGDGRAERGRVEGQIRGAGEEGAAGNGVAAEIEVGAATREEVEAALVLLGFGVEGRGVGSGEVEAGLALLVLRAGVW